MEGRSSKQQKRKGTSRVVEDHLSLCHFHLETELIRGVPEESYQKLTTKANAHNKKQCGPNKEPKTNISTLFTVCTVSAVGYWPQLILLAIKVG